MNREGKMILVGVAVLMVVYVAYRKGGATVARFKTWSTNRKQVITGTASKGDDSGGVLTAAQ